MYHEPFLPGQPGRDKSDLLKSGGYCCQEIPIRSAESLKLPIRHPMMLQPASALHNIEKAAKRVTNAPSKLGSHSGSTGQPQAAGLDYTVSPLYSAFRTLWDTLKGQRSMLAPSLGISSHPRQLKSHARRAIVCRVHRVPSNFSEAVLLVQARRSRSSLKIRRNTFSGRLLQSPIKDQPTCSVSSQRASRFESS